MVTLIVVKADRFQADAVELGLHGMSVDLAVERDGCGPLEQGIWGWRPDVHLVRRKMCAEPRRRKSMKRFFILANEFRDLLPECRGESSKLLLGSEVAPRRFRM